MKLSLCMIVKNEEDVLERCLSSVLGLVDEIIIVDTGSTDRTKEIAAQFTERVYDFTWVDDFSAARNYSFSLATGDYCLWLDADDLLLSEDRAAFLALREHLSPSVWVVMMKYHTGFDAQGNVTFSYYRERIVKNHPSLRWKGAVHEVIEPMGEIIYSDCAVTHRKLNASDPDRNLKIFEKRREQGEQLEPREQFYYGRELYYHQRYREAIEVFEAFLDSRAGWIENNIDACCHLAYCFYGLGEGENALLALLRSLSFDLPRAEVCCDLGKHFLDQEQYRQAAFWYTLATTCKQEAQRGGFTAPDCYGYLPCIQLCVCYSRMGQAERAKRFNELAAGYKPDSPAVAYNRAYFSQIEEEKAKLQS